MSSHVPLPSTSTATQPAINQTAGNPLATALLTAAAYHTPLHATLASKDRKPDIGRPPLLGQHAPRALLPSTSTWPFFCAHARRNCWAQVLRSRRIRQACAACTAAAARPCAAAGVWHSRFAPVPVPYRVCTRDRQGVPVGLHLPPPRLSPPKHATDTSSMSHSPTSSFSTSTCAWTTATTDENSCPVGNWPQARTAALLPTNLGPKCGPPKHNNASAAGQVAAAAATAVATGAEATAGAEAAHRPPPTPCCPSPPSPYGCAAAALASPYLTAAGASSGPTAQQGADHQGAGRPSACLPQRTAAASASWPPQAACTVCPTAAAARQRQHHHTQQCRRAGGPSTAGPPLVWWCASALWHVAA